MGVLKRLEGQKLRELREERKNKKKEEENIIVFASTIWMEDDNYLTTYGTIYCVMGLRRIIRHEYDMVKW